MPDTSDRRRTDLSKFSPPTLIGQFVLGEMEHRNLGIAGFCKFTSIDYYTLYRLLERDVRPTLDVLWDLSKALQVELRILILLSRPEYAEKLVQQAEWELSKKTLQRILSLKEISSDVAQSVEKIAEMGHSDPIITS